MNKIVMASLFAAGLAVVAWVGWGFVGSSSLALVMTVVMVSAAGSTLDSTFSSLAKLAGRELPALAGRDLGQRAIGVGIAAMLIFAVLGNLPMLAGTDILKATTISGTIVQTGGTLSSNGIVLATHTHPGVQAGGSNTGGPQ